MQGVWRMAATPTTVATMRRAVSDFGNANAVADPPLADVAIAVSEAVTNVVMHSYRDDPAPGWVEVSASREGSELRVVVTDEGLGYGPRPDSPGIGLGMGLIASLTDHVEIRRHAPRGTEVHMCFNV